MLRQRLLYSNSFDFSNRDAVCNQVFISPRNPAGRRSFYSSFVYPSMKTLARTLFIITLVLAFFSQSAVASVLTKVTRERLEDGREVVNLFFNEHSKPKAFSLPGDSPRLVFDFPDVRYSGQQKIAVDGVVLRTIRIFTHQNPLKTRVVFDLRPGSKMDYSQEFLEDGHTLRISLSGKGEAPPPKMVAAPVQADHPSVVPAAPAKAETAAPPPAEPKAEQPIAIPPPALKETLPPAKAEAPVKPPAKPPLAVAEKSEQAGLGAAGTAASPLAERKVKPPVAVSSPAQKETLPPPKTEPSAKPPAETPLAAPVKPAPSSPFDSPFLATESPAKPAENAGSAAAAAKILDYSLTSRATGGDVLRLQLDGYANPEITAHEGSQPQLVCFFPKMRLAAAKGIAKTPSGKFVRKVAVTAQEKPSGVKVVLDLTGGYDYDVQQIFVKDELAFLLIVNVFNH